MKKLIFIFLIYNTAFAQTGKFSVLNISSRAYLSGKRIDSISVDSTTKYGANTKLISEKAAKAYSRLLLGQTWSTLGNLGTAGTGTIGTNDNYGFSLRTNSVERISIWNSGEVYIPLKLYIGSSGPNFGYPFDLLETGTVNTRIGTTTATSSGGRAILNFTVGYGAVNAVEGWRIGLNTSSGGNDNFTIDELSSGTVAQRLNIEKSTGNFGFKTNAPTTTIDINDDKFRVRTAKRPASSTATGNAGDICWDANYIYVCTATNTWVRSALATW